MAEAELPHGITVRAGLGARLSQALDAIEEALAAGLPVAIACERSLEGVLSAVGLGYLAHAPEGRVRLCPIDQCQPRLTEALVQMPDALQDDSTALAQRVYRGFRRKLAQGCGRSVNGDCGRCCPGHCMRKVVLACANDDPQMPEALHRYLRLGFSVGHDIESMHQDPRVAQVEQLERYVSNECEHTRQFVRFSHYADGSYGAVFRPQANTLPLCASYFSRRMGTERFYLADPVHGVAVLHEPGRGHVVMRLDPTLMAQLQQRELAADEHLMRTMWKRFYDGLELQGRGRQQRGYDLRTSWMPQRFWGGLTELDPRNDVQ